jgi:leucyl-tRNA synthetase
MVEQFLAATEVQAPSMRAAAAGGPQTWSATGPARDLRRRVHEVATQILDDMDRLHLNTAVSGLMQLVNAVHDYQAAGGEMLAPEVAEAVDIATRLLGPLAPHTAEGAWERLGHAQSIFRAGWPTASQEALARDLERLVVQVNGKVRAQVEVPVGAPAEAIQKAALADAKVLKFTEGKTVAQVIHVPGRLVNIVVK